METVQAGIMAAIGSFVLGHIVLWVAAAKSKGIRPPTPETTMFLAGVHLVVGFAVTTLYGTVSDVAITTLLVVLVAVLLLTMSLLQITTVIYRLPRHVFFTVTVYWIMTLAVSGVALALAAR